MRIGIFGDIHGNHEALTAVFKELEPVSDVLICTGDVVGYGASPRECIDFIRKRKIACIRGNHDHYTTQIGKDWKIQPYAKQVIRWMQETLEPDYLDWLGKLPFTHELEGLQFVHSSLEATDGSNWPYILNPQTAMFHFFIQHTTLCFYGHTHLPLLFTLDQGQITFEFLSSRKIPSEPEKKFLINPGSVGQPRDFDSRASAVVFDTKTMEIELLRVEYNVAAAQEKIIDADLPEMLAERLSKGR